MEFRSAKPEDYEAIRLFLAEAGWQHRVSDPERFRAMLEKTDRAIVACEDARVIGFARALCDGVSNGYISMVAVASDWRGQGIGRKLVECLMGDDSSSSGNITWVLRAGRGSEGFWEKVGFRASEVAMERVREVENEKCKMQKVRRSQFD
ncbi:MAG: GNAT family N-acetyltransferase [Acidobacteria bacterium]|nr:GNAT family N-acetyltransferase [Acidobacteriota bacterium]